MQEGGIRCRHDKERGRRKCKIPKKVEHAGRSVRRWVKKEPSDFKFESGSWQLNLLLEMIRERFGLECNARTLRRWLRRNRLSWRKSRHVPYKTASQKRANGVQAKGRRAGVPDARRKDTPCLQKTRLQSRRSRTQIMAGGPRAKAGDDCKTTFSTRSIRMFGAMSEDRLIIKRSRLGKLGDVPRIPRRDPPGSSKILHGTGQRILPQVKNDSGVRGICRRRHRP